MRYDLHSQAGDGQHGNSGEYAQVIYAFLQGPFTQKEERSLNASWMLDLILSSESAREIAQQLDPTRKYHQKIVRNDHLGILLDTNRDRAWEMLEQGARGDTPDDVPIRKLFEHYMQTMSPFVVGVLKDTLDPNSPRKQLPQGLMEGVQGRLNLFILIQDVIENQLQLTKEQVAQGIVNNQFTAASFQPLGLGGALMTCFNNSPARMMLNFLRNHPNDEWREYFGELELRHFAQVDNLWTQYEDPADTRGWKQDTIHLDWVNYGEARLAIREVIHNRCGFPFDAKVDLDEYIDAMHSVIQTLTQEEFDVLPGKFGRTYSSVRMHVYGGSIPDMMYDFLHNHPNPKVRVAFSGLRPYHFPGVMKSTQIDVGRMQTYSDLAFQELFEILTDPNGLYSWSYSDIPTYISAKVIEETPLRFGSTAQVFVNRFRSYTHAVISALQNHPNESYRRYFEKLRLYHFQSTSHDTWSMDPSIMPDPPYEGWTFCSESKRWKNKELAREALDEFFECLFKYNHTWEWNLELVAKKLTLEEFRKNKIHYKADIRSMVAAVYFDSAREAILDYLECDLFSKRVAKTPTLTKEIEQKWGSTQAYIEFAKQTLENRRGHRQLLGDNS